MRDAYTQSTLVYAIPMSGVIPTSVGGISAGKNEIVNGNYISISGVAFRDDWFSGPQQETRVSPQGNVVFADSGRNDPVVVSDDESIKEVESDYFEKITLEAYRHFASTSAIPALTENVFIHGAVSLGKVLLDENRDKIAKFIDVLSKSACESLSELPATSLSESIDGLSASVVCAQIYDAAIALVQGKSATSHLAKIKELRLVSLMNRYIAILSPGLADKGYSPTEPYLDGIGGLIVDFLNSEKRICFALTPQEVQILHMKESEPQSRVFENPEGDLLNVMEYIQEEF